MKATRASLNQRVLQPRLRGHRSVATPRSVPRIPRQSGYLRQPQKLEPAWGPLRAVRWTMGEPQTGQGRGGDKETRDKETGLGVVFKRVGSVIVGRFSSTCAERRTFGPAATRGRQLA